MSGKEKLWMPNFVAVTAVNFVTALTYYLVTVKIVEYAYVEYQVAYSVAGFTVTAYVLAAVLTRLVFGGKMDSFGLRRSALLGEGLIAVASVLYLVPMSFVPLLLVRAVHGIGFAISTGSLASVAALLVPRSRQGEGISYFSMSTALAMGIGPMLAMMLMNGGASFTMLFAFSMVMSLAALGTCFMLKVPSVNRMRQGAGKSAEGATARGAEQGAEKAAEGVAGDGSGAVAGAVVRAADDCAPAAPVFDSSTVLSANPKPRFSIGNYLHLGIFPMTSVVIPLMFCYSGVMSFMTVFAQERNLVDAASVYFLVYAVSMLLTRPPIGRRLDKRGENSVLYLTIIAMAVGLAVLAFSFSAPVLLLSAAIIGFGVGATQSTVQAIVPKYADAVTLGKANSTFFLCLDAGYGLGPMIIGAFLPAVGYTGTFLILAAVTLASCGYYHVAHGRKVWAAAARSAEGVASPEGECAEAPAQR